MGKRARAVLGLLALHAGVAALAAANGYRMQIVWSRYQLLDRIALEQEPLSSLWLLHSQPPLLNLGLAVALRVAAVLGTEPEIVAGGAFFALGASSVLLAAWVVRGLTGSAWSAGAAAGLLLLDPGFVHFQTQYFYTFPVAFLLLAVLAASLRHLRDGSAGSLVVVVLLLAAVALTRALFHPLWALAYLALLLASGRAGPRRGGARTAAAASALLLVLLAAWPVKNWIVFGQLTMTSWVGQNLANDTPVDTGLVAFWRDGVEPPGLSSRSEAMRARYGAAADVVTSAFKSDGSPNWNHLAVLEVCAPAGAEALRWRREHPTEWLWTSLQYYPAWSRATYVHSHRGTISGPSGGPPTLHARWYRAVLYADLRPLLEGVLPEGSLDRFAIIGGRPVPLTLYGLLLFPAVLLAATAAVLARWREGRPQERAVLLGLYCIAWTLVVPCLTDGLEGNRMRYPTSNLVVVVGLYALHEAGVAWSARRAVPRAEAGG